MRKCETCFKEKPDDAFNTTKAPGNPAVYKSICKACESIIKSDKLANDIAKRKMERELKEEKAKLRKEMERKDRARVKGRARAKQVRKKAAKVARKQVKETGANPEQARKEAYNAAAQELALRELSKKSLINFTKRFQEEYEAGWVHKLIAMKLEKFAQDIKDKKAPRLMIFMPPRTGKSQLASVMFPAWYLGHNPTHELISASYAVSLPIGFSRKIKDIVRSEDYKNLFDTRIDPNAQASEFWKTSKGGAYVASGVGTGITGKGGHCFPADTLVQTPRVGPMKIQDLRVGMPIFTCDIKTGKIAISTVDACKERFAYEGLFEITTATGHIVRSTPDHKFYVPTVGWREAQDLQAGDQVCLIGDTDSLQNVRHHSGENFSRLEKAGESRDQQYFLQSYLSGCFSKENLSYLRKYLPCWTKSKSKILFQKMSAHYEASRKQIMRLLRRVVSTASQGFYLLLNGLQKCGSFSENDWTWQFQLLRRYELLQVVRPNAPPYIETGHGLSDMWDTASTGNAPYRWESSKQHPWESGNAVQTSSHETPQVEITTVSRVERVSSGCERVYDIQVEGTHCFFANEVLTHNCMILDDPLKDAAEADSEVVRNSVWDWYSSTFRTRLAPGGGILVILTRWHDDDPAGRLLDMMRLALKELDDEIEEYESSQPPGWQEKVDKLKEQYEEIEQWEVLSFPALAEHDEFAYPDGTVVPVPQEGTRLLRLKDEALHPERFDEVSLKKVKRTLQPRHWSALYQQNPVPEEGVYFTKSMMRYEPVMPDYRQMHVYSAWDLAIGTKQTNDWSVGLSGGLDFDGNLHILDMVRFKGNTDHITENLIGQLKKYREQIQKFGLEQGQIQMAAWPTIERALRKEKIFIPWDNTLKPITDKMARARPAQGMMQQGRIILPQNQPWVDDFVAELLRFPGGKHDDVVDALAWLVRMVMKVEPPKRPKAQQHKSWKDQLGKYIEGRSSGKTAMSA